MKGVGIAELKAKLSAYLKKVEGGESITVLDRRQPVARIVPHSARGGGLTIRPRRRKPGSLHRIPLPPRLELVTDAAEMLREDRERER